MSVRVVLAIGSSCVGVALLCGAPAFSQIALNKKHCCKPAQPAGPAGCTQPCQPGPLHCGGGGAVVGFWINGDCVQQPDAQCGEFTQKYKKPLVECRTMPCQLPPPTGGPGVKCVWVKIGNDTTDQQVNDCQGTPCPTPP